MKNTIICQFAKWPELGKVKTRIAKTLGDEQALSIHIELLFSVMNQLSQSAVSDYQLWLSKDDTKRINQPLASMGQEIERFCQQLEKTSAVTQVQESGDLGYKMHNAFERLCPDYRNIIIVGSDCPTVTQETISKAVLSLQQHNLVLSPAEDGGYVLIGIQAEVVTYLNSNWLSNVSWGTPTVLEETLACCHENGLSVDLLEELWDVDEVQDYKRWKGRQ